MCKLLRATITFWFLFGSLTVFGQTTSIMTFNIRLDNPNDNQNSWNNRKNELAGLIEYYHPDIFGIEEGLSNQVDFIKRHSSNYNFIGIGREGGTKGEYSCIYYDTTKFELLYQTTFWLSDTPDTFSVGWDAALPRICTYGKFKNKSTNDTINIFNTHFDHIGTTARKMSAKLILSKLNQYELNSAKVIVMGDFNSTPNSEPITILKKRLDYGLEKSEKSFYGPLGTFNGFNNCSTVNIRIDYIFTKNISVYSYRHIDDKRINNLCISDHFPVLIEIKN